MTHRERAEALGWERYDGGMWVQLDRVLVWASALGTWWPCPFWIDNGRVLPVECTTEDDALAHALLLRDVVLS